MIDFIEMEDNIMAKKKIERELTIEEKLQQKKERELEIKYSENYLL